MSKHSKGKADGGKKARLKYHASWMDVVLVDLLSFLNLKLPEE